MSITKITVSTIETKNKVIGSNGDMAGIKISEGVKDYLIKNGILDKDGKKLSDDVNRYLSPKSSTGLIRRAAETNLFGRKLVLSMSEAKCLVKLIKKEMLKIRSTTQCLLDIRITLTKKAEEHLKREGVITEDRCYTSEALAKLGDRYALDQLAWQAQHHAFFGNNEILNEREAKYFIKKLNGEKIPTSNIVNKKLRDLSIALTGDAEKYLIERGLLAEDGRNFTDKTTIDLDKLNRMLRAAATHSRWNIPHDSKRVLDLKEAKLLDKWMTGRVEMPKDVKELLQEKDVLAKGNASSMEFQFSEEAIKAIGTDRLKDMMTKAAGDEKLSMKGAKRLVEDLDALKAKIETDKLITEVYKKDTNPYKNETSLCGVLLCEDAETLLKRKDIEILDANNKLSPWVLTYYSEEDFRKIMEYQPSCCLPMEGYIGNGLLDYGEAKRLVRMVLKKAKKEIPSDLRESLGDIDLKGIYQNAKNDNMLAGIKINDATVEKLKGYQVLTKDGLFSDWVKACIADEELVELIRDINNREPIYFGIILFTELYKRDRKKPEEANDFSHEDQNFVETKPIIVGSETWQFELAGGDKLGRSVKFDEYSRAVLMKSTILNGEGTDFSPWVKATYTVDEIMNEIRISAKDDNLEEGLHFYSKNEATQLAISLMTTKYEEARKNGLKPEIVGSFLFHFRPLFWATSYTDKDYFRHFIPSRGSYHTDLPGRYQMTLPTNRRWMLNPEEPRRLWTQEIWPGAMMLLEDLGIVTISDNHVILPGKNFNKENYDKLVAITETPDAPYIMTFEIIYNLFPELKDKHRQ